jgi:plasmid stabilization system protein ParE
LDTRNKLAARRAAEEINRSFAHLMELPEIGRPVPDRPGQRELIIPFGDAGYVALYRFDADAAALVVLAFRHTKEAGV